MRKSLLLLATALALSFLPSCGDGGEYVQRGEYMCYTYWTFSFGRLYDTLPEADPRTFKTLKDWLGEDARHVYFKQDLIQGAKPGNIKVIRYPLICDGHDYFYESSPMHVTDYKTFTVVKWHLDDNFWAMDSKTIYYDTLHVEGVDRATFKIKDDYVAVDKNHVYRFGKILHHADPATYVEDWKGFYSRDKSHIWYMGEMLTDVDYNTFTIDKEGNASDKYGRFEGANRLVPNDTPDDVTSTPDDEAL